MDSVSDRLFLIGPMGSGKSTIGRRLARHFDLKFLDCDRVLEERTGASVNLIFDIEGESGFREREHRLLDELSRQSGHLLATGGGVVTNLANHPLLARGFVVYLKTSVKQQLKRLYRDQTRPLLQSPDRRARLESMAEVRDPLYEALADLTIASENRSVKQMAGIVSLAIESAWSTMSASSAGREEEE